MPLALDLPTVNKDPSPDPMAAHEGNIDHTLFVLKSIVLFAVSITIPPSPSGGSMGSNPSSLKQGLGELVTASSAIKCKIHHVQ
jgi:hypothetical protein